MKYFSTEAGKILLNRLKAKDKTLKELDLSGDSLNKKLDADDVNALAVALRGNASLIALNLSSNGLGPEG